jgi:hypothetical protein
MAVRASLGVPLEELTTSKNIMVYGPPGGGKTCLAGTAPNGLFLATENGVQAARRQGSKSKAHWTKTWDEAWSFLLAAETGSAEEYSWITIDTLSTLENRIMRTVLDEMFARSPRRDPDLPDRAEHQLRQNRLKKFVERMIDLPINTIWLCHEMRVEDENGDMLVMPSISGGADKGYPVANYIMGLMDAVGYMRPVVDKKTKEEHRRIIWQPFTDSDDRTYRAKDQFDAFGAWTDDWTWSQITAAIGEEDPTPQPKRASRRAASKE